jgi:hypothetical protein
MFSLLCLHDHAIPAGAVEDRIRLADSLTGIHYFLRLLSKNTAINALISGENGVFCSRGHRTVSSLATPEGNKVVVRDLRKQAKSTIQPRLHAVSNEQPLTQKAVCGEAILP